jgi:hypothetical protein
MHDQLSNPSIVGAVPAKPTSLPIEKSFTIHDLVSRSFSTTQPWRVFPLPKLHRFHRILVVGLTQIPRRLGGPRSGIL